MLISTSLQGDYWTELLNFYHTLYCMTTQTNKMLFIHLCYIFSFDLWNLLICTDFFYAISTPHCSLKLLFVWKVLCRCGRGLLPCYTEEQPAQMWLVDLSNHLTEGQLTCRFRKLPSSQDIWLVPSLLDWYPCQCPLPVQWFSMFTDLACVADLSQHLQVLIMRF